jgi:hypothetical protein
VIRIGGAGSRSAVSLGAGCDAGAAKADGESAMKVESDREQRKEGMLWRGENGKVKSACVVGVLRALGTSSGEERMRSVLVPVRKRWLPGYVTCAVCPAAQYWIEWDEMRRRAPSAQDSGSVVRMLYKYRQKHAKARAACMASQWPQGEAPRFALHVSCNHLAGDLANLKPPWHAHGWTARKLWWRQSVPPVLLAVLEPCLQGLESDASPERWAGNIVLTLRGQ